MKDRVVELMENSIRKKLERGEQYSGGKKECYEQHGPVMKELFPDGLPLRTAEDFGRFGILNIIVGKIIRYSNNFEEGGHDDSLEDISVYCNMLRELDEELNK